ncbi:MAG: dihydrofolate reductase [Deltaproteobacteria bacterium]|nr:dihydrofolate reductase [Deltaproteobacteria bacterium]
MITSMIAAMGKNRVIGKNNQLMWHLPEEMQYFKDTTLGHHIIMGRKTFDAHPKALPGRTSVIITRDPHYVTPPKCIVKDSIASALNLAQENGETEAFIIGGAQIYAQTIDMVDRIYLTYVDFAEEGDTYFPTFDASLFDEQTIRSQDVNKTNPHAWVAKLYIRK